ncbi:hypothetical protein ACEYYB_10190 [Paracoccus sp. p4-l81]|uniref:hypothetical protein n=1 Tax=Paracoccus sp. p4-l81 TaxID=3342806 RepID=UPI0035B7CAE5
MAQGQAAPGGPDKPPSGAALRRRGLVNRWTAGRLVVFLFVTLPIIVLSAVIAGLILTGQPLNVPARLTALAEERATQVMRQTLGEGVSLRAHRGADLVLEAGMVPQLRLRDIDLMGPGQGRFLRIGDLRVSLDPGRLLVGQVAPRQVVLRDVTVDLLRDRDGAVVVAGHDGVAALPGGMRFGGGPQGRSPGLSALRQVLAAPTLAALRDARVEGLDLRLIDQASGQQWQARDARLSMSRRAGTAEARAEADLWELGSDVARPAGRLTVSLAASETGPAARLQASLQDVSAPALAAQNPALGWLALVDAPVSGVLTGGVDPLGQVAPMDLTLRLGAGTIRPGGGAAPITLNRAMARLYLDPARARLSLRDLELDSRALRLKGAGHADLTGPDPISPQALVGQIRLSDVAADPQGVFATPARFDYGLADWRLRLDPLRLDIGQIALGAGEERLTAAGQLRADDQGWSGALDFRAGQISLDRLLALWPVELAGNTRQWLAENVATGLLRDARGALRLASGSEPVLSLAYAFSGAEVRLVKTLPPVQGGAGYATIQDHAHVLVVDRGAIAAPGSGDPIDVARTVLSVPDIRARPAQAEADLRLAASIPAALELLDQPPFEVLRKAGQSPRMAAGQARLRARVSLPLLAEVPRDRIDFRVDGTLSDVTSTVLVPGKTLTADSLDLRARRGDALRIKGRGRLQGVPFQAEWWHGFAAADRGRAHLKGTIDVTPAALSAFDIDLPKGMVTGKGSGRLTIDFIKDQPGPFRFATDTTGLRMAIPQIGWTKDAGQKAELVVEGAILPRRTGLPTRIDRLAIRAPGLRAEGPMVLRRKDQGGGLERADLGAVTVGDWFNGAVRLTGRGAGRPPAVAITGGRADLTRAPLTRMTPTAPGAPPMPVRLDRLQVTRGIFLTDVTADLTAGADGSRGPFRAALNGRAPVNGQITPGPDRRASVTLGSDDAGAVLAATGIFPRATGGRLALQLDPVAGGPGRYDGRAVITGLRVAGLGALATALPGGTDPGQGGTAFDRATARFRITPNAIEITEAAAIGPTLGISAAGLFLTHDGALHIKGVISPLFGLNPGGAASGEALIGLTYKLRGTARAPKISINPASILAPGVLRDLFRRPAPTLQNLRPAG